MAYEVVEWAGVAVRFGLYLSLMVLFGMPLFSLYAIRPEARSSNPGTVLFWITGNAALLGLLFSFAGLVILAKALTGSAHYRDVGLSTYLALVQGTQFGMAWITRIIALMICLGALFILNKRSSLTFFIISPCAAVALASLAWGGHGVMDEGIRGAVHLTADIVHLLAAGIWIGAITSFLALTGQRRLRQEIGVLSRASSGFAMVGTVVVGLLTITGLVNYLMIEGFNTAFILSTIYGRLLVLKIGLFVLMLIIAAVNRFFLVPALKKSLDAHNTTRAAERFLHSLIFEAILATGVLFAVAWLGVMSPQG